MRPAAILACAAALLAGCASASSPFTVQAMDPVVMAPPATPGFGYDGTGMVHADGTLAIDVKDGPNEGTVHVDLAVPSGPMKGHWVVHWTDFHIQPSQAWQDGGVACGPGLAEHGASGHGNKMEPQLDLACGGWGTANATRDGAPVQDPLTGATAFNAHFMVTQEAMLQGGKVLKADGKTPFDPHDPGDGSVDASRREAHFALWGSGAYANGIAVAPVQATTFLNDTATGGVAPAPTYTRTASIVVPAGSGAHLHLQTGTTPGQASLTLLDPKGQPVDGFTVNPTAPSRDKDVAGPLAAGNYTMRVDAQGASVAYQAAVTVAPGTPLLLHVVFQDVKG